MSCGLIDKMYCEMDWCDGLVFSLPFERCNDPGMFYERANKGTKPWAGLSKPKVVWISDRIEVSGGRGMS